MASRTDRDHPRACGEHPSLIFPLLTSWGSSPRMRGTRKNVDCFSCPHGIIPAHAGNTTQQWAIAPARRDHPRACGEHAAAFAFDVFVLGSSPRMRGTRRNRSRRQPHHRIIPAHAGNTGKFYGQGTDCGDHPRACGEHMSYGVIVGFRLGSSPRMRGTPH